MVPGINSNVRNIVVTLHFLTSRFCDIVTFPLFGSHLSLYRQFLVWSVAQVGAVASNRRKTMLYKHCLTRRRRCWQRVELVQPSSFHHWNAITNADYVTTSPTKIKQIIYLEKCISTESHEKRLELELFEHALYKHIDLNNEKHPRSQDKSPFP